MTADLRREEIARIAEVLNAVGASDIEQMAWSPLTNPPEYEGDPDFNVIREDPYPMASLATRLYDAGLRSQDTSTARIAALEGALLRLIDATTNYINADEPRDYAAIAFVKARHNARAVLSGETRTGGEGK